VGGEPKSLHMDTETEANAKLAIATGALPSSADRGVVATPSTRPHAPRIGLVLGSGAARGWAHIGVIRALERAGIRPDLVCGTSAGALVGAAYASGNLERLGQWAIRMRMRDVVSFFDLRFNGGLLNGSRLMSFARRILEEHPIERLPIPFGAVATTLETGAETWLRTGSTLEAVRASMAMPGLFSPVPREGVTLVDGALTNPVPVSLGRAMGADVLIAVDLSSDVLKRNLVAEPEPVPDVPTGQWMHRLRGNLGAFWASPQQRGPSMLGVVATSLDIMLVRITRSRMAGEPPDVIVAPRLGHLGLFDFGRAAEAIKEGERAMTAALENLRVLGLNVPAVELQRRS
jgi:NTE family protein